MSDADAEVGSCSDSDVPSVGSVFAAATGLGAGTVVTTTFAAARAGSGSTTEAATAADDFAVTDPAA